MLDREPCRVPAADILLAPAATADDWRDVRELFARYVRGLGIDLAFQGIDAEIATLPGAYAAPLGTVILARAGRQAVACGAVRPRPDLPYRAACEMKRLYVCEGLRGASLGRRVAEGLMAHARGAGFEHMLLDTLDTMASAQALYASLGFVEVPAYYENPLAGTHYLCARL